MDYNQDQAVQGCQNPREAADHMALEFKKKEKPEIKQVEYLEKNLILSYYFTHYIHFPQNTCMIYTHPRGENTLSTASNYSLTKF